jgi:hypothetical protein
MGEWRETPMRWFVTVHRGETAAAARPVVSTAYEPVVKDVLSSLARHLGIGALDRRPSFVALKRDEDGER